MTADTALASKRRLATRVPKSYPRAAPIRLMDRYGSLSIFVTNYCPFQQDLFQILSETLGHHATAAYSNIYPVDLLARHYDNIKSSLTEYGHETERDSPGYEKFFSYIEEIVTENKERMQRRADTGMVEFDDLGLYFSPGDEVFTVIDNEMIGGIIEKVNRISSMFGIYYEIEMRSIGVSENGPAEGIFTAYVNYYKALKKVDELPVVKITATIKETLAERGKLFERLMNGSHYMQYSGQLAQASYWATRHFRADGRIMVDTKTFNQVDNDQFGNSIRSIGIDFDGGRSRYGRRRDEGSEPTIQTLDENQIWRTSPFVLGFSVKAKRWGKLDISKISDIEWRSDAFDKLVLDKEEKELVKALVEHNGNSFSDLIDGKGGGCIFLLHGPPGQGKTLTAEAVAELLHRPLYSISVGELGITPDQLEDRLRTILDTATVWNAVILLDEADIFLEARDEKDIQRNAMVGVFLRLLEYHQGVLFLTTNRVKNIDKAFYSRVSVALYFKDGGEAKRLQIWKNILDSAKVEISEAAIMELAKHELNGRQIKNVTRLVQTLSTAYKKEIDLPQILKVIDLTTKFEREDREKYDHAA